MWSKKCCDTNANVNLKDVIGNFIEYIQFHKIPANVLMHEVHPLGLVPNTIIVNALAYQVRTLVLYISRILDISNDKNDAALDEKKKKKLRTKRSC